MKLTKSSLALAFIVIYTNTIVLIFFKIIIIIIIITKVNFGCLYFEIENCCLYCQRSIHIMGVSSHHQHHTIKLSHSKFS